MDWGVAATGLLTGLMVGVTGMGGGALTMPLLTLVFGVPPLAAVSSDLVAAAVVKPVGAAVHLRRGTVRPQLVGWLCLGSLPCAAVGSLLAGSLGRTAESVLEDVIGVAVLLAAGTLLARMWLDHRAADGGAPVRPVPTVLLGGVAGMVVGLTSVGSGSIVIVVLLLLHRGLSSARLVGTDLVHAVPLVLVAAAGHLLAGDVRPGLVGALLVGSLPGVLVGALVSARVPDRPVRVLVGGMLVTSGSVVLGADVVLGGAAGLLAVLVGAALPLLRGAGVVGRARGARAGEVSGEGGRPRAGRTAGGTDGGAAAHGAGDGIVHIGPEGARRGG